VVPVGNSEAMRALCDVARRVAAGDAKVLVTGESGVGKDVLARFIHAYSARSARPFVAINCAAISETLLESELFGHVRGAFTGAYKDKVGRLQLAHRGTIFLDELGETSARMQALLLRFLESGEICPVGSEKVLATVDVRVIAATNRELDALVRDGHFREDLLYRIKVVHLHVPPLREHIEDLPELVEHLLGRIGRALEFTPAALQQLRDYHWPGNVRELYNVLEQVGWIATSDVIDEPDLPPAIRRPVFAQARAFGGQIVDDLFDALKCGRLSFWGDVYRRFLQRDMTRDELRNLVRRGLEDTGGNYRLLMPLFGISSRDYKRFLNFLAAHDCTIDFRRFRAARESTSAHARA
jgi:transcriptional regulator with PAS, ATPase and Fis domain